MTLPLLCLDRDGTIAIETLADALPVLEIHPTRTQCLPARMEAN